MTLKEKYDIAVDTLREVEGLIAHIDYESAIYAVKVIRGALAKITNVI